MQKRILNCINHFAFRYWFVNSMSTLRLLIYLSCIYVLWLFYRSETNFYENMPVLQETVQTVQDSLRVFIDNSTMHLILYRNQNQNWLYSDIRDNLSSTLCICFKCLKRRNKCNFVFTQIWNLQIFNFWVCTCVTVYKNEMY